jgi:hypothetical protein
MCLYRVLLSMCPHFLSHSLMCLPFRSLLNYLSSFALPLQIFFPLVHLPPLLPAVSILSHNPPPQTLQPSRSDYIQGARSVVVVSAWLPA